MKKEIVSFQTIITKQQIEEFAQLEHKRGLPKPQFITHSMLNGNQLNIVQKTFSPQRFSKKQRLLKDEALLSSGLTMNQINISNTTSKQDTCSNMIKFQKVHRTENLYDSLLKSVELERISKKKHKFVDAIDDSIAKY